MLTQLSIGPLAIYALCTLLPVEKKVPGFPSNSNRLGIPYHVQLGWCYQLSMGLLANELDPYTRGVCIVFECKNHHSNLLEYQNSVDSPFLTNIDNLSFIERYLDEENDE